MMSPEDYYGLHLFLFTTGWRFYAHVEITKTQRNVLTDLHILTVIMAKTLWILFIYSM